MKYQKGQMVRVLSVSPHLREQGEPDRVGAIGFVWRAMTWQHADPLYWVYFSKPSDYLPFHEDQIEAAA